MSASDPERSYCWSGNVGYEISHSTKWCVVYRWERRYSSFPPQGGLDAILVRARCGKPSKFRLMTYSKPVDP